MRNKLGVRPLFLFFFVRGFGGRIYAVYIWHYYIIGSHVRWYQYMAGWLDKDDLDTFTARKRSSPHRLIYTNIQALITLVIIY